MAPMTQTQTPTSGTPDPDRRPDSDLGPDGVRTQTPSPTQTQTPDHSDPDRPDLGPGLGPNDTRTQTAQTRTQTQTSDSDLATPDLDPKINNWSGGPGPDDTQTQTTQTRTRTIRDGLRHRYPGGFFARHRAAAEARRLAYDEAVLRGAEAELLLLEAEAQGELEPDDVVPPARWEKFVAGYPAFLLTIVVAILASVGQVDYAKAHGVVGKIGLIGFDLTPWFAPAVLDLSVAALFGRGMYVAIKNQGSPWIAWIAGLAIGGFSVYTNTQHTHGAVLYAAATAVGLISWMVGLIYKYLGLPHVKAARIQRKDKRAGRRATANPRLLTSSLLLAGRQTAIRGWVIARRRPMSEAAERISQQQGLRVTVRDLTIRAAELFNSVVFDRQIAELEQIGEPPAETDKAAFKAWQARRDQAIARAELVAWDAVDELLGIPVIQREGILVNRITYVEPLPAPQPTRRPALTSTAAAPATLALSATTESPVVPAASAAALAASRTAAPIQRHKTVPALPAASDPVVVVGPTGGSDNYLPLARIEGLRHLVIDPELTCTCHSKDPNKYCGKTLLMHVERRGRYITQIVSDIDEWGLRPERIGNTEIRDIVGGNSKGLWMELSWVMDQLRALAQQQQAQRDAEASSATVVIVDEPPADPQEPAGA